MTQQTLMPFEAVVVATEAAKCEAQRAAEQHEREAKQAARILAKIQREKRQAEEEIAKNHRRFQRASAHKYRSPDEHAQCGIRWYCRSPRDRDTGTYWKNCHACGQPLIYTADRDAKPQTCAASRG
jgi:hypothetical protein